MSAKGWLPWLAARRAKSNDRRRKCSSSGAGLRSEMSPIAAPALAPSCRRQLRQASKRIQTGGLMSRHVPPDLGEIGFAGAGLVDEFAVEHHDKPVREFEQFIEVFADQKPRGAAITRSHGP